jgi:hypothetical protein
MAYRRVRSYGNTMGATSGAETANFYINEERIGKCLRQVEHIRGHL